MPTMMRKLRASIFTVGWRETKRPIGPAATIMSSTETMTAAIMTGMSSTMPTAVMIESSENTRSMMAIWTSTPAKLLAMRRSAPCSSPSMRPWISPVAFQMRKTPPASRMRSRPEISSREHREQRAP